MNRVRLGLCTLVVGACTLVLNAQTGVFFNEGWESGTRSGSFNSNSFGAGGSQMSVQNAIRASGNWAFRHLLTAGLDPGSIQYATQHFGDAPSGPVWPSGQGQHFHDIYIQYKVHYSAGFDFHTNYKQLIIGTQDDSRHEEACCNPWVAHYLTLYVGVGGPILGEVNNKQGASGQWIGLGPNANGYNNATNRFYLQSGRWYTIEVRRRLNDAGVDNGIYQMWVDGLLIADHRSIRFRVPDAGTFGSNFTYGTNFAMISDYALTNVTQNQSIYYDDVKFSTSYIGTISGPAPTPPTNLRILR